MNVVVKLWRNSVVTTFLAGLVLLLPVVLTVLIMAWIIDMLKAALGPGSFLGGLLTTGGMTLVGPDYEILAFWLGMLVALVGIWVLGIVARGAAQQSLQRSLDQMFARLPLVRAIYNPISRVVRMATDKEAGDLSRMTVVSCRFGGDKGVDILALLANQTTYYIGQQPRKMVYLPAAPIPMSGGLVLVPAESVVPVPEMKVDDLLRVYFSLGALAPDTLPRTMKPVVTPEAAAIEIAADPNPKPTVKNAAE
jgi:uncharacterized membrane protein